MAVFCCCAFDSICLGDAMTVRVEVDRLGGMGESNILVPFEGGDGKSEKARHGCLEVDVAYDA